MEILTDRSSCESILSGSQNSILGGYQYKSILNSHYNPDAYMFFTEDSDLVPLVEKNGLVTFYGGTQHNASNTLPNNPRLINNVLAYLNQCGYSFRLLSIKNDCFGVLNSDNRIFDVPFPTEWHFLNIHDFDQNDFLNYFSGKSRWSLKRVLRRKEQYQFATVSFDQFRTEYPEIIQAHKNYFSKRGKSSVWDGQESLLLAILESFNTHENLFLRVIKFNREISAVYALVHNRQELIYFFGGSLRTDDHYISKVMFFDLLNNAKILARKTNLTTLNGLRGAFTNKKRFKFKPVPLYALVKDKNWIVRRDSDIGPDQYCEIYGRNFGRDNHD